MHVIRFAEREDIPMLHQIRLTANKNHPKTQAISEVDYLREMEIYGQGWVLEQDDEPAGFAIANSKSGQIWALAVLPQFQGHGAGQQLLKTALEWLQQKHCHHVWVETEVGSRAESFYQTAGWISNAEPINSQIKMQFELLPS